jgi:hypothetical protein
MKEKERSIAALRYVTLLFAQYAAELSDEWPGPLDQQAEHVSVTPTNTRVSLSEKTPIARAR